MNIDIKNLTESIAAMVKRILEDSLEARGIEHITYDTHIHTEGQAMRQLKIMVGSIEYLILDASGAEQVEREIKVSVSLAAVAVDSNS